MSEIIAHNIKKFRKELKMTQEQLADKVGISLMSIRRYEANGSSNRNPNSDTLIKIADALHVEIADLLYKSPATLRDAQESNKNVYSFYLVLKLLECVYDKADSISVTIDSDDPDLVSSSNYIAIKNGEKKIALTNFEFDKIIEMLKEILKDVVELVGHQEETFLRDWEAEDPRIKLSEFITEDNPLDLRISWVPESYRGENS